MTQKINLTTMFANPTFIRKSMLIGGGIALLAILIFLLPVDNPNPAWGKYWIIRPILVVPIAGAMGGLFYALMDPIRQQGGLKKILANTISLIVYIIGLWMGTVLGLAGTMWN